MSEIKLKPCPFCGGENVKIFRHRAYQEVNTWSVCCHDCGFGSVANLNKGALVELWNTRAEQIPKKPIYSDFEEDDDRVFPCKATCPVCGYEFPMFSWNDEENHHCVCGQRIKW